MYQRARTLRVTAALGIAAMLAAVAATSNGAGAPSPDRPAPTAAYSGIKPAAQPPSIHKIKHVVVIMQENRSFDSYFGTYPGADGYPTAAGRFSVCVPNPATSGCDYPYHDPALVNMGAKHNGPAAAADIAGGNMTGFIREAQRTTAHTKTDHFLRWNARKDALLASRETGIWKQIA